MEQSKFAFQLLFIIWIKQFSIIIVVDAVIILLFESHFDEFEWDFRIESCRLNIISFFFLGHPLDIL